MDRRREQETENNQLRLEAAKEWRHELTVPKSVDHGTSSNMDDSLLGSDPPQLRIGEEIVPSGPHVGEELLRLATDEAFGNLLDSGTYNVVTASDCEGHSFNVETWSESAG